MNYRSFQPDEGGVIVRSAPGLQAYYPRIVRLSDTEFLASFNASRELETPDTHPELARSVDGGLTWSLEGPVDPRSAETMAPTEIGFLSRDDKGTLFCSGSHFPRNLSDPDGPLVHPKTVGMRDNRIVWRRSMDRGHTWSSPTMIPPPFDCPLEIPTGFVMPDEQTVLQSFATWKRWDGNDPYGHRVAMIRSTDRGRTWSPAVDIFYDATRHTGFWEGRIIRLGGRRLLATCWAHGWQPDEDLPNHYALSPDQGSSWSRPRLAPVRGQTGWPLWLGDQWIFFLYNHRRPPVGIRGQLARIDRDEWQTVFDHEVWSPENRSAATISHNHYAVTSFQFGAPSVIRLDEHRLMAVFWCVVNHRAGINWVRIRLQ